MAKIILLLFTFICLCNALYLEETDVAGELAPPVSITEAKVESDTTKIQPPQPDVTETKPPDMTLMEQEDIIRDQCRRMNNFSLNLQKQLHIARQEANPNNTDNMVFSPYSIYTALAMLALGANDNTKKQIYSALNWETEHFVALKEVAKDIAEEGNNVDTKLDLANNVWSAIGSNVLTNFQDLMENKFGVKIEEENFARTEAARRNINNWIRTNTGDRIVELFKPGSISADTKMVLANAIYFKGHWNKTFKVEHTQLMNFNGIYEVIPNVPFMFQNERVKTMYHGNIQLLELPYGANHQAQFTMLFARPVPSKDIWRYKPDGTEPNNVNELCEKLDEKLFNAWMDAIDKGRTVESDVYVPRFTVKHGINLREKLQLMGISDVFSRNADLSGITGNRGLFVSSAQHQAVIEVDEKGSKAVAATGFGITLLSAPPVVTMDHPFLFFILNKRWNTIVFAGKVANPRK